jgi:hypothetical protein
MNCVYLIGTCCINELCVSNRYMFQVICVVLRYAIVCYTLQNCAFSGSVINWDQKLNKGWNPVSMSNVYLFMNTCVLVQ